MPIFDNPFDANIKLSCSCGRHASEAEHQSAISAELRTEEQQMARVVQSAVLRAVFPNDGVRRSFLRAVGVSSAMAALSQAFPMGAAVAAAGDPVGVPEKKQLNIGFLPIVCSTPLLVGHLIGFFSKQGLQITMQKNAGWLPLRDKVIGGELDAAHLLAAMPLGLRAGVGGAPVNLVAPVLENLNGSALTLHLKHKDNRNPAKWQGMKFAVPSELAIHNFLLREYLVQNGLDPNKDVQIKVMTGAEMLAGLRAGTIDGFTVAEPFNQRAVLDGIGFIHLLSADLWDGHPCCAFTVHEKMLKETPNTYGALMRGILRATTFADLAENRWTVASVLSTPEYLNQPIPLLEQVLTGTYPDGLGTTRKMPRRIAFEPLPWESMASWLLHEMKRWGYLKKEVNYQQIAEQVFRSTDARKQMAQLGIKVPADKKHVILGKEFDPERPDAFFKALGKGG